MKNMKNLNLKQQELSYLKLKRIILTVVFALIIVGTSISLLFSPLSLWHIILIELIFFVLYALVYIYQGAYYRNFSYAMNDFGLYINRGVFWRKKIIVPRNRVQHTDVNQGPIERKFKLAELIVHTAGTRNASVNLPGVLFDYAEELRESLSFDESNDAV